MTRGADLRVILRSSKPNKASNGLILYIAAHPVFLAYVDLPSRALRRLFASLWLDMLFPTLLDCEKPSYPSGFAAVL